jgi:hypothetical protein
MNSLFTDPYTLIMLGLGIVSFILRKLPVFSTIWFIYKVFFIAFLAVLVIDKAKDEIKDWWKN